MVVEFIATCQNPFVMTKEEFLSGQSAAEHQLNSRNKSADWFTLMLLISMFIAVPYLTVLLLWTISEKAPAYGLLWEIAFCLLVLGILWFRTDSIHRKTVANLESLGVRCPICNRFSIFEDGKITAETGKCWHSQEHCFFTIPVPPSLPKFR